MRKCTLALGLMLGMSIAVPAHALQCVPYARQISGIDLQGDAWRWWAAAQGVYDRGNSPQVGGVLVFKQTPHMRHGHVAVVRRVISRREIRIDHANWGTGRTTGRGQVSLDVAVIDVSPHNDWSQVRVWHEPSDSYGARINPAYGFIYSKSRPQRQRLEDAVLHSAQLPSVPPPVAPHVIHSVSVSTLPAPAVTVAALQLPQPAVQPPVPAASAAPAPAHAPQAQPAAQLAGAAHLNAQVLARLRGAGAAEPQRVLQAAQPAPKPAVVKSATAKPAGKVIKVSTDGKAAAKTKKTSAKH